MTFWVLRLPKSDVPSAAERAGGAEVSLTLPFTAPDLSRAPNLWDVRHVLSHHMKDAAPETLARMAERYHRYVNELQAEDLFVIPDQEQGQLYFAQALGRPRHGEGDQYTLPVRWFTREVSMRRLRRYGAWYQNGEDPIFELHNAQIRTLLRDRLPLKGNRFAKIRWLIVLMVLVQAVYFAKHLLGR